jgi:hypothetical protein
MKLLIALCVLALALTACAPESSEGRVVVTVTDAATNMGAVTSVEVTIDKVEAHSATEGWVTLSANQKTVDLLELKATGAQALLADETLTEGSYDQMRLEISNVVVTDADGDHEAKLPSNVLKVNTNLTVGNNTTSTASFDFIADESLHVTGNGKYILAPVVHVETREDAQVDATNKNAVVITQGTVRTNTRVGMDVNGNVDVNVHVPADADLRIDGNTISVGAGSAVGVEKKADAIVDVDVT